MAWSIELGQHDIDYKPRTAIKAQALADFMVECSFNAPMEEEIDQAIDDTLKMWSLYVDGSVAQEKYGGGMILTSPNGFEVCQAVRFTFKLTNNEAEYEALISGMKLAHSLEVTHLQAYSDSQLVVKHFSGEYDQKEERLRAYAMEVRTLAREFEVFDLIGISREDNGRADALSRLATGDDRSLEGSVYKTENYQPSVYQKEVHLIGQIKNWMTPIRDYLEKGILPPDRTEARKIKYRAASYIIMGNYLYRRSATQPLLRCATPEEARLIMEEVHEGICADHLAGKALSLKVLRHGYFWPSIQKDAFDYVKKCHKCQIYANILWKPPTDLTPIICPIPFAMWGIDIVGKLLKGKGQAVYCVVAVDYMTKWVEARPLSHITEDAVVKFVKEYVIYRFGIPKVMVSDNGTQFKGKKFLELMETYQIEHHTSYVAYPQSNGQVENANKTIIKGIEKRLEEAKGLWVDELLNVLWAYRTTPRKATNETPFKLAYGTDALVPVEIGLPSYRSIVFNLEKNEEGLRANVDLAEELREKATLHIAAYQQKVAQHFDSGVKKRLFHVGDYVLRETATSKPDQLGKLMPNWEGPYKIVDMPCIGTCRLETTDGVPIKNTWNVAKLKKYYQ